MIAEIKRISPYMYISIALLILFIIWALWGGEEHKFVGLAPLDSNSYDSYMGSVYNWGHTSEPLKNNNQEVCFTQNSGNQVSESVTINDNIQHNIQHTDTGQYYQQHVDNEESTRVNQMNIQNFSFRDTSVSVPNPEYLASSASQNNFNIHTINPENNADFPQTLTKAVPTILDHKPNIIKQKPKQHQHLTSNKKNKTNFVSKGERICCETMEKIYGVPFITVRPNWLRNPETGENLELDCYNEQLSIAVEYNGEQHYKWPNFTNQSNSEFINQVRRDMLKADICEKRGTYLITIPYTVPHDKIPDHIISKLPETIRKRITEEQYNKSF
jgi:hypothetical protein